MTGESGVVDCAGAASMLARALKRFAPYPDRYAGFDLAAHREELRAWQARVAGEAPLDEAPGLPRWRFENLGE